MSGRPWLEALKEHSDRRDQGQGKRDVILADAPYNEPIRASAPAVDISIARVHHTEDERRLLAAGWSPKDRCGPLELTIWANPETGFYYSQEVALHRLGRQGG